MVIKVEKSMIKKFYIIVSFIINNLYIIYFSPFLIVLNHYNIVQICISYLIIFNHIYLLPDNYILRNVKKLNKINYFVNILEIYFFALSDIFYICDIFYLFSNFFLNSDFIISNLFFIIVISIYLIKKNNEISLLFNSRYSLMILL